MLDHTLVDDDGEATVQGHLTAAEGRQPQPVAHHQPWIGKHREGQAQPVDQLALVVTRLRGQPINPGSTGLA
jgi:hypothetical protein